MEALKYFKQKDAEFAQNYFDKKYAIEFCKDLYDCGAVNVEIVYEYDEDEEEIYADTMIVTLPKDLAKRTNVIATMLLTRPDEVSTSTDDNLCEDIDWATVNKIVLWWD